MYSINIFRQTSLVRLSTKRCPIQLSKCKSSDSKEDLKEKLKMKTPIGNVK